MPSFTKIQSQSLEPRIFALKYFKIIITINEGLNVAKQNEILHKESAPDNVLVNI